MRSPLDASTLVLATVVVVLALSELRTTARCWPSPYHRWWSPGCWHSTAS